mmetsp:Transcript_3212/g.7518  ORF Transcript_3212/g.7518 Transcript_3212/m.7518 type:complete len:707 (+) Transcript_3212:121-2241(+)|eukprot:CAMPEP_0113626684 /NCGR_PEP_ID=MMETSP0017_2-20120614/13805_1 /TAXON_ID=2856 /ORGANISM="Cylindrotheca closterium" /LENGTH=706 /DNA_ID=CAMNT_0000536883 /DNA_START=93 /DNA_END=2213 /DNA_ORIENTATION=+ /assembly_acc=CAM_ASM_000147
MLTETTEPTIVVEGDKNSRFPCVEQPTRVALHCNGYYLWCKRNGKLICRRKRNDKDEFFLRYDDAGTLAIQHHKFKGLLTALSTTLADGTIERSAKCFASEEDEKKITALEEEKKEEKEGGGEEEDGANAAAAAAAAKSEEDKKEEEEEEAEQEEDQEPPEFQPDDQKWCFVRGAADSINANAIIMKSISTGLNLGIDDNGQLRFGDDDAPPRKLYWSIECVTGELCFMSNPRLKSQTRCDMSGLLNMDANMKGWEVFRFMEAGHGFVKISSWMHSQWLLCSTKDGLVDTCSHAESFKDYRPSEEDDAKSDSPSAETFRCSKWAIEKNPNGEGVIIRSKTHGRLLCVRDNFELRTWHPDDEKKKAAAAAAAEADEDAAKIAPDDGRKSNNWQSFTSSMRDSMKASFEDARKKMAKKDEPIVPESETTVWYLEAAHSQNYYFLSLNMQDPDAQAKSVGPGLEVTPNLRKNTKIEIIRENENITKLCIVKTDTKPAKNQFLACETDGSISLLDVRNAAEAEWIMQKSAEQEGCTVFKSVATGRYLSMRPIVEEPRKRESTTEKLSNMTNSVFGKEKEVLETLHGSETLEATAAWKLDPCMPRAVSSDKIKTFALGTSIAVGTTVAMPFALAGVAGFMGAIGAEVGTFTTLVFAGLTGAEAIASVGAIGATAYLVFKPEENSLTDDHSKEEAEEEKAWSQRPFSNWRNW